MHKVYLSWANEFLNFNKLLMDFIKSYQISNEFTLELTYKFNILKLKADISLISYNYKTNNLL